MKRRKTKSPGWQILGVAIVAGGLVGARYFWEPTFFIPDIRPFLPSNQQILFGAGVISTLILLYHFWYSQFARIFEGLFIAFFGFLLGTVAYVAIISLFHFSEFTSFEAFWNFVFYPTKAQASVSHGVGRIAQVIFFIGGLWEGGKTILGFGAKRSPGSGVYHQRGRQLIHYEEAASRAAATTQEGDPGLFWGMLRLPSKVATTHFAVVGSTGSGKTLTLRFLMQSVLPQIGSGGDTRALIYDAKQDMLGTIAGINPHCEILTLNPFDKRSVAWDMAKDITAPATAQQIAAILIPENKNAAQPFFADAARHLLSGVLISFIQNAENEWTLRDVLIAMKSQARLKAVLKASPDTKDLIEQYFSDETTARNVMSTVATKMQRYEFIAAVWGKAERSISLREWLKSESILVLGNDEATRTALDAINQVIFKRLSELILAQTESETRRTWVFLDELRQAGKLEGLSSLLTKGRSKGACVVLGYQDIEGLREVYGYQLANEIAGQCANKAILRCDSADTARWASALFGEREVLERRESFNQSSSSTSNTYALGGSSTSGTSTQTSEQVLKREVVLPSEIMDIPPTTPENGLTGVYLTPLIGAYWVRATGEWIAGDLISKNADVVDLDPRDEKDQYMKPWDDKDVSRLKVEIVVEKEEKSSADPAIQIERDNVLSQVSRKEKRHEQ